MRVVIFHFQISGYAAACWRALAQRGDFELLIVAQRSRPEDNAAFSDSLVSGLPCRLLSAEEQADAAFIRSLVAEQRPDVVTLPGWVKPALMALPWYPELSQTRFVMTMDTQYRGDWRQRLARLRIGRYIDRMDRVVVPGDRSWQYASRLGVPQTRIRRGCLGVDVDAFAAGHAKRLAQEGGWPKRFLYAGRYVPEKALDVLVEAYAMYRREVSDPWPLSCCGEGPMRGSLQREGIEDLGFVHPPQQPEVFVRHGVFVLASRYEPWGQVLVEACASGLPVVVSEACGAMPELVRPYYNGLEAATGNAADLARGLRWMHEHHDRLPEMGGRAQELARPYSAQMWAERWSEMFRELAAKRP